jgi:hypothetical protein
MHRESPQCQLDAIIQQLYFFPIDYDTGLLVVPTGIGVPEPSGNGLYLLPHQPEQPPSPSADHARGHGSRVALTALCDPVMWHRRFGHLNMQSLHAPHTHGVSTSPALVSYVKMFLAIHACSTRPLLHQATLVLARNHPVPFSTCALTFGVQLIAPPHLASAIVCSSSNHHTHYMWVRFLKSKDDACYELENNPAGHQALACTPSLPFKSIRADPQVRLGLRF